MIYGYARVSTDAQDLTVQLGQLKAAGCEKIFRDKLSGATADRPQLTRMLKMLAAGDVVITPAVDRLSRDTTDLLVIARDIQRAGAGLRSLAEPILDTTSDFAEVVLAVLGIAAKFERRRIGERTALGRIQAKLRGVKFGRKPKLTEHQQREAIKRRDTGQETTRQIALDFAVSHQTISRLRPLGGVAVKPKPASLTGLPLPAQAGPAAKPKPSLDAMTERAARAFMQRLDGKYAVIEGLVYGSRARGTHRPDSDTDLAVVMKGPPGDRYAAAMEMAGIAFDVLQETGVFLDPLPLWEGELKRPGSFSNPALIQNIKRDGLRL